MLTRVSVAGHDEITRISSIASRSRYHNDRRPPRAQAGWPIHREVMVGVAMMDSEFRD